MAIYLDITGSLQINSLLIPFYIFKCFLAIKIPNLGID